MAEIPVFCINLLGCNQAHALVRTSYLRTWLRVGGARGNVSASSAQSG